MAIVLSISGADGVKAGSLLSGADIALDRFAVAVDGVESSHGADPMMWRPEAGGPQGPMQVSSAAAADVGGGDRFDASENRALGRAYLARLYRHYGSWQDAVAAYSWGPGNMDAWIGGGRRPDKLPEAVALYRIRVLYAAFYGPLGFQGPPRFGIVHAPPRRSLADRRHPSRESIAVERLSGFIMRAADRASLAAEPDAP